MLLSFTASATYAFEPNKPSSSPINSTNSIVLSGCSLSILKVLAISNTAKEPMPLSIAPVARSQLSKCPPTTTFSLGNVFPLIVATIFLALMSPEKLVMAIWLYNLPDTNCSFKCIPSSLPIQTAGMGMSLPVTEAVPVSKIPPVAVLITMIPLAPCLVAMAVFSER